MGALGLALESVGAGTHCRSQADNNGMDIKENHFWAAETHLLWGTARYRTAFSWQGVQFPVRQCGERSSSATGSGYSSSVVWCFFHPHLLHHFRGLEDVHPICGLSASPFALSPHLGDDGKMFKKHLWCFLKFPLKGRFHLS